MGNVVKLVDTSDFDKKVNAVNRYFREERRQAEKLKESAAFNLVWLARKYDTYFLDPIVGFILPGFGDALSSVVTLPALYVAMFKIRSIRLTLAILTAIITDVLVGLIPVAGDIVDAFYKSSKMASRLIVGYMEDDEATKKEINRRAIWGTIGLIAVGVLIYLFIGVVKSIISWVGSLL